MFTDEQLSEFLARKGLGEEACAVIRNIRASQPSRPVGGGKRNVICRFASRKMGRVIQTESHTNELAAVWTWEHDPNTHEFWDQPPAVPLRLTRRDGRPGAYMKTADFFLLQEDFVGWQECKTAEELEEVKAAGDQDFYQDEEGRWRFRPGELYAQAFGLGFRVRLAEDNNPVVVDNLKLLADFLGGSASPVPAESREAIMRLFESPGWQRLYDVTHAEPPVNTDHLYQLIADGALYFHFERDRLSELSRTYVFRDRETAEAHDLLTKSQSASEALDVHEVDLSPGRRIVWDSVVWTIVNAGEGEYSLIDDEQRLVALSPENLQRLIASGRILGDPETPSAQSERRRERLLAASEGDRREAVRRYRAIHRDPEDPTPALVPGRTLRHWRRAYRCGVELYGNGFVGLLPGLHKRGNHRRKLSESAIGIVRDVIKNRYKTGEDRTIKASYGVARLQCRAAGVPPPSEKTFGREIRRMYNEEELKRGREGDKAAYAIEPWVWRLEEGSPRHGQRPFELGHVDHTEFDLQIIDERFDRVIKTRKCWCTAMIDAYSRVVLAVYITFDAPSYRSCMAVIRECVRRHGRVPATIVVDWGKEFRSQYFEQLLAFLEVHKKHRPKGSSRHGGLIESLFNRFNLEILHQLRGNNRALQNPRSMSKSHDPRRLTPWTIGAFTEKFERYVYEIYPTVIHGTLGVPPRQAFELGLRDFGPRRHRRIACDEAFRMMCLPSTEKGTAKVRPGGLVKINSILYSDPALLSPRLQGAALEVRYDPFDMSRAYAYAEGKWLELRSEHAQLFCRYSEREVEAASKEIRQRLGETYRNREINGEAIARYLLEVEQKEAQLQREREAREAAQGGSPPAHAADGASAHAGAEDEAEEDLFAEAEVENYGDAE